MGLQALAVTSSAAIFPSTWAPASLTSMRLLRFWKSYTPSGEEKARRAAGGQHVVGACAVVASFRWCTPQEDRARVAQQRLPAVWVGAADFQVLARCDC